MNLNLILRRVFEKKILLFNMKRKFLFYLVISVTVDRLGDGKDQVNKRFEIELIKVN
jgi:hypothetical protein